MPSSEKISLLIGATKIAQSGGIATYIRNVAQNFADRGCKVSIVATNSRGDYFETLSKTVDCYDLSTRPLSPQKVREAALLVNKISPDILLLNHCSLLYYTLPLLNRTIKPVAVIHSDDARYYATATMFSHRIFRWVAPTHGVANNAKKYLKRDYARKIKVIPHGTETVFSPSPSEKKKSCLGNIVFVGHVDKNKGAELLPPILCNVHKSHPAVFLTIVGQGPLKDEIEASFLKLGLKNNYRFTGTLDRGEIAETLRESDIFLLPTRIEGFGLAIVEAMMCGTVPVVTKLDDITDTIVNNGISGILIQQGDVGGFSNAIIKLLKEPQTLFALSKKAAEIAKEKFKIEDMIDHYMALFQEKDDRAFMPQKGQNAWVLETLSELIKTKKAHLIIKHVFRTLMQ